MDRLTQAIKKLIRSEINSVVGLRGTYEYSVQKVTGRFVSIEPTDTTIGLPSIDQVSLQPSTAGESAIATVGSLCTVVFLNGSPAKPRVTSLLQPSQSLVLSSFGDLSVVGDGLAPTEHVMTVEAAVLLVFNVLQCLTNSPVTGPPGPWTGSSLQPYLTPAILAALSAQSVPAAPGLVGQIAANAALIATMTSGAAPSNGLGPLSAGLTSLSGKTDDVSGFFPSVGSPATRTG